MNEPRSQTRVSFETLFTQFTRICFYFNYVSTFYINLVASKHVRRLARFYLGRIFCRRGQIHPIDGTSQNISMTGVNQGRVHTLSWTVSWSSHAVKVNGHSHSLSADHCFEKLFARMSNGYICIEYWSVFVTIPLPVVCRCLSFIFLFTRVSIASFQWCNVLTRQRGGGCKDERIRSLSSSFPFSCWLLFVSLFARIANGFVVRWTLRHHMLQVHWKRRRCAT